ncbi:MAG TPA: Hsp20/alpha crystallin family protein [Actinomycetota bacterium]|nr:Hsp20/alpha crystallin family protein [Actinomycetota bacterium]
MRLGTFPNGRDVDDVFQRFFGSDWGQSTPAWSGFNVPTDVFHTGDKLVIRMDLPGVNPDDVEVTVQESTLLINGKRAFPFEADEVRFVRRGTFYGDFTQKVALGKGLDLEQISANFDNGVLELTIPYLAEVQPKKISIQRGAGTKALQN